MSHPCGPFVEDRDVRLDPPLRDEPVQHLCRAIAGIGGKPSRLDAQAFGGAGDHGLGRADLGLPHRRGGLDIKDDGTFQVDEVVVGVGEYGRSVACSRPARGGIDW